jgi:ABC-type branched-subunit amino acid transport system ATPase component
MIVLQVKNVSKQFDGIRAIESLSFELRRGTITALIGPNGAGKSTIFNIISGFLRPDSGEIQYEGRRITSLSPSKLARIGIGRTFQNIKLFSQMSLLENVMLATQNQGREDPWTALFRWNKTRRDDDESREKATRYLHRVGLLDKSATLAEDLSHGQRRLLEIARVLAMDSRLFLLDEPMAGLFPQTAVEIIQILRGIRDEGKTILLIEHDMKTVVNISDWIIVLEHGRSIAEGRPVDIQQNEVVINAYLGRRTTSAS